MAQPVIKWPGGKSGIADQVLERFPPELGRYFEPFVGGGALFFRASPSPATIADLNPELVELYLAIRDTPDELAQVLGDLVVDAATFEELRSLEPASLPRLERAARVCYLSRTAFNGLFRVNGSGRFNAPMGDAGPDALEATIARIPEASAALQGVTIWRAGFLATLAHANPGDFAYLDPPYDGDGSFVAYTAEGWTRAHLATLAAACRELSKRGVRFLASNADTPAVRTLFAGFLFEELSAPRAIAARGDRRRPAAEVLIRNYTRNGDVWRV